MNLNQITSQRQLLRVFGGLNEGYACSEAELSKEKNFSSRGYPALETRKPRRKVRDAAGMNGMYHLNGLLTVEGTTLRYAPDDGSDTVELKYYPSALCRRALHFMTHQTSGIQFKVARPAKASPR